MKIWPFIAVIALVSWREIRSLGSIQANNFFYAVLLLGPGSFGFLGTLLLLLMALPALGAPLGKLPAIRLALWPVANTVERILGPFVKPSATASPRWWPWIPVFELRLLLRTLDFWLALLIAASASAWRWLTPQAPPEAFPVLSLLVVLALSTLAQNLFGLEGSSGRTRRKLSPQSGAFLLARQGVILLAISVIFTVALSPLAAFAGMLAALAVGHYASVFSSLDNSAWRFSVGQFFPHGALQAVALFSCGIATSRDDLNFLALAILSYLASLFVCGFIWERS